MRPLSGFSVNGAGLGSGSSSIEITARPLAMSVGKASGAGALSKKSSPGKGGLLPESLYGALRSPAAGSRKAPVVTGVPAMTTQPS
jgi:hypothetical protein